MPLDTSKARGSAANLYRLRFLYSDQPGGLLKLHAPATKEEFDKIVATGEMDVTRADIDREHPDFVPDIIRPYYIQLLSEVANFDFLLDGPR